MSTGEHACDGRPSDSRLPFLPHRKQGAALQIADLQLAYLPVLSADSGSFTSRPRTHHDHETDAFMKALTVMQPWASVIAAGVKTVENRNWRVKYRGRLAIHAGGNWSAEGGLDGRIVAWHAQATGGLQPLLPRRESFPAGAVIAVARLVDCHWDEGCCGPWGERDAWHWCLRDITALAVPVTARGALGLWTPDPALLAKLEAA